jgi:hypothetical protein
MDVQGPGGLDGEINREDLAGVLTGALAKAPASGLTFAVTGAGPGTPPKDWGAVLGLMEEAVLV